MIDTLIFEHPSVETEINMSILYTDHHGELFSQLVNRRLLLNWFHNSTKRASDDRRLWSINDTTSAAKLDHIEK